MRRLAHPPTVRVGGSSNSSTQIPRRSARANGAPGDRA